MKAYQTPNVNPDTGVPYGYISARALDPDLVGDLMYGAHARDHTYEQALDAATNAAKIAASELGFAHGSPDWEDFVETSVDENMMDFYADEPIISGRMDGVEYQSSWLGGALNFWIFKSPLTTDKACRASPCVPGAAILDTLDGAEYGYDVPADWRAE